MIIGVFLSGKYGFENDLKRHIYFATCDFLLKHTNYVTVYRSMSRPVSL
jgi:hypothetical protein